MIEWMDLIGWPLAMLGVSSLNRSYVDHKDQKLERDVRCRAKSWTFLVLWRTTRGV